MVMQRPDVAMGIGRLDAGHIPMGERDATGERSVYLAKMVL